MYSGKCSRLYAGAWRRYSQNPLIWVHTLMCLVLLFYFAAPGSSFKLDSHQSRILHKLQQFGAHPDAMHYSLFEKPDTVYCIFQVDFEMNRFRAGYSQPASLLYVGSTAIGAAKRHLNRMAVYRRLQRTEFVDAELHFGAGLRATTFSSLLLYLYRLTTVTRKPGLRSMNSSPNGKPR